MRDKAERIVRQKIAVEKYEKFLIMVKEKSGGEYSDIEAIVKRYDTLTATYKDLTSILNKKEADLSQMKNNAITYEKTQNTEIMKLNN